MSRDDARACEHRTDSHNYRVSVVHVRTRSGFSRACTTDAEVAMALARAALPMAQETK